jgi:putative ABC transport system permease protein
MSNGHQMPPRFFHRFFRWYCHPRLVDHIEGDLLEVYGERIKKIGKRKADSRFIIDVLLLLRPKIVRPTEGYKNLNNYGMIKNYFRIGWRNLIKRKGFAMINIAGLALGFSCSILIYLFVNQHLQYDTFHNDSERIYRVVTEEHRDIIEYDASVPPGFAHAFKADYPFVEKVAKIAIWYNELIILNETDKRKEHLVFAEDEFFDILNFPLINGNRIPLTDPHSAFITERAAKKMYGNEDALGKTFQLENEQVITVIGILKDLPKSVIVGDIFISFETLKNFDSFLATEGWGGINGSLQCFTKLYPNQNVSEIEEAIQGYVKKFRPTSKNVHHYKLQPLSDIHFNPQYSGGINPKTLWIFSSIGLFLLIIASINFINISTAQSISRSKEVGVRKVLGSQKNSLFWQFMTETFLITVVSFLVSVFIIVTVIPPFNTLFGLELSLNDLLTSNFWLFSFVMLLDIALLSGSYPGIVLARIAPLLALKGKVTQQHAGGLVTRKVLVVAQFIISIILIIGTVGINKQINYAIHSDLGYDKSQMVMLPIPGTPEASKLQSLKNQLAQLAGVEKISACFGSPGASYNDWGTSVRYNNESESEEFSIQAKMADKDYLSTFNLELVAGRNFYEKDSTDEILVNETFAKKMNLVSPEEVLGKVIDISSGTYKGTIVGVVKDFHDRDFHESINAIFIAPSNKDYNEIAIKINMVDATTLLSQIEQQWSSAFPNYIFEYEFLDDRVAKLYESEQRFLSLTQLFSGIAIFIGSLGIYGLILFFVVQKTKEIGIRKVLGGSVFHILTLVTQDFLKLLIIAGVIASPLAWFFINRWLENFIYKTEISWWIFAVAIVGVAMVTLLTISYQAIKAALANPVDSLRNE